MILALIGAIVLIHIVMFLIGSRNPRDNIKKLQLVSSAQNEGLNVLNLRITLLEKKLASSYKNRDNTEIRFLKKAQDLGIKLENLQTELNETTAISSLEAHEFHERLKRLERARKPEPTKVKKAPKKRNILKEVHDGILEIKAYKAVKPKK